MRRRVHERRWKATLGGGLVALVAVGGLLEALRRCVRDVDRAVAELWTTGKRLAQNTQSTHLLQTTKARTAELRAELEPSPELRRERR